MALPRRPLASWATILRHRSAATARAAYGRQAWRQARTRGYATEHGGATKKSDIPWLIGSVAFTAPTLWYIGIWKPDPNAHHGHGEHEEHSEEGDGKDEGSDEGSDEGTDEGTQDEAKTDKADPNKDPKSANEMSGKQEGIANDDTKHSTDPVAQGISNKPEGGADTAKSKGTVDVNRPQK